MPKTGNAAACRPGSCAGVSPLWRQWNEGHQVGAIPYQPGQRILRDAEWPQEHTKRRGNAQVYPESHPAGRTTQGLAPHAPYRQARDAAPLDQRLMDDQRDLWRLRHVSSFVPGPAEVLTGARGIRAALAHAACRIDTRAKKDSYARPRCPDPDLDPRHGPVVGGGGHECDPITVVRSGGSSG